jgi:diacylglycerol kinase family enzyme
VKQVGTSAATASLRYCRGERPTGEEIRIEADREVPYGADGEVEAVLPVTARVLPGALRVLG